MGKSNRIEKPTFPVSIGPDGSFEHADYGTFPPMPETLQRLVQVYRQNPPITHKGRALAEREMEISFSTTLYRKKFQKNAIGPKANSLKRNDFDVFCKLVLGEGSNTYNERGVILACSPPDLLDRVWNVLDSKLYGLNGFRENVIDACNDKKDNLSLTEKYTKFLSLLEKLESGRTIPSLRQQRKALWKEDTRKESPIVEAPALQVPIKALADVSSFIPKWKDRTEDEALLRACLQNIDSACLGMEISDKEREEHVREQSAILRDCLDTILRVTRDKAKAIRKRVLREMKPSQVLEACEFFGATGPQSWGEAIDMNFIRSKKNDIAKVHHPDIQNPYANTIKYKEAVEYYALLTIYDKYSTKSKKQTY